MGGKNLKTHFLQEHCVSLQAEELKSYAMHKRPLVAARGSATTIGNWVAKGSRDIS